MTLLDANRQAVQDDGLCAFINELEADAHLAKYEIRVQKAWLHALERLNLFSAEETKSVEASFDDATELLDKNAFPWDIKDEDIHMHLERFITSRHGDLGKRMHLGRSRNDLVATTFRLYIANACDAYRRKLAQLISALTDKAEEALPIIVPGTTHSQHGQPVYFAHVLLAHAEAFLRDRDHLEIVGGRAINVMPLGASAMAGTSLRVDLKEIAKELGFKSVCRNSYDAVGDRDFVLNLLDAYAKIAVHLSRFSEDIVYWASTPVQLVRLPWAWSTGSSIMPNKRNPEVAELTRGRCAHILAAQFDAHILMRTAPTSYCGELQEIKGVVLRAQKDLDACFSVLPHFVKEMQISKDVAHALLNRGHILATEVADNFALNGIPFRDAYTRVKNLIIEADKKGCQIHELDDIDAKHVSFEACVEKCSQSGGTSRAGVLYAIRRNRKEIK